MDVRYLYYSGNLNRAAQNRRLGRMRPAGRGLGIAALYCRRQWSAGLWPIKRLWQFVVTL